MFYRFSEEKYQCQKFFGRRKFCFCFFCSPRSLNLQILYNHCPRSSASSPSSVMAANHAFDTTGRGELLAAAWLVVGYLMVPEILSWPRSEMLSFDLQGSANPELEA